MRRTGAQIVWEMLEHEGVGVVFGIPGGAIMHTYHHRQEYSISHVLTRHEQGAVHAADGYARASGRVGVTIATSGPGATNLVTGIATAMMDSSPLVCITGQTSTSGIGSDAFQEADITGITLPITKHNYLVTDVEDLAKVIHEAFYVARSGRPGPVLIDLPKDVQQAEADFVPPEGIPELPGYHPVEGGDPQLVNEAEQLINDAQQPLILAGHGVLMSGAVNELRAFAEKTEIPVALTLLGKGSFPESHRLSLGMMGMHGTAAANHAIQRADLLLAFGMRFDDRVTGDLAKYAPRARKIHVDLDITELNKLVPVDVPILGDLKYVLRQFVEVVESTSHDNWLSQIADWQEQTDAQDIINQGESDLLCAPWVINSIWKRTEGQALLVTDVGQHQMWAAQYCSFDQPNPLITSGGLGTMGFGLPAAIGAQIARPDKEVWAIIGDGGFQMTLQEMATLRQERLPVRIAIINNGYLGMVRQWQEMFYEQRYESTQLSGPNFCRLADAYEVANWHATNRSEADKTIKAARSESGPALIEFAVSQVGENGNVYPMVPSGAALDDMIRRPRSDATDTPTEQGGPHESCTDCVG